MGVGVVTPRYRSVKGTRDLLPPESERWAEAERIARETFRSRAYGEIRTPVLEDTALFARSVGETTDIVHKEMYTFEDRKGRSVTMRPENTAGVVRAIVENGLAAGAMPLRLYYIGPQFRYERPQAGRYREFSQIGVELFGIAGPAGEAEVLEMLFDFLHALGFRALSVTLNSVGTAQSRAAFGDAVRAHVAPRSAAFGADDRRKLEENPLRLFDSKDPDVRTALEGAAIEAAHAQRAMGPREDSTAMAELATHGMTVRDVDRSAFAPSAERLWSREASALGVTPWLEAIRV